jgi:hypothetical protein
MILKINHSEEILRDIEGRVGVEPTMELTFTRLTVWTFRPTKATKSFGSEGEGRTLTSVAYKTTAVTI